MAIAQQDVLQAIYDLIHDSITTPLPGGGRRAASREGTYLTLAFPGIGIDEALLADPWSPTSPGGSMAAAEHFALLTDPVPRLSPYHSDSGISLDRIYGEIVSAGVAPSAAPPPRRPGAFGARAGAAPVTARRAAAGTGTAHPADLYKRVIAASPAPVRRAFKVLYTEGTMTDAQGRPIRIMVESPSYSSYLDRRAAQDAAVTGHMAALLQQKAPPRRPPPPSPQALAALAGPPGADLDDVEAALSAMGNVGSSSVVGLFSAARLTYELTRLGSLLQPGLFWHAGRPVPANWLSSDAAFVQIDVQSEDLRLGRSSRFAGAGARAEVDLGLWRRCPAPRGAWEKRSLAEGTSGLHISCRFARVEVRRPWLDPSLFMLGGWFLPGRTRSSLSTGTLENNPGIFSLLPSSMIVTRDVQISARWAQEDADLIDSALSRGDRLGFGPFAIGGASPRRGAPGKMDAHFDGLTISAPALQIIGWLSTLVPACPPLDG